VHAVVGELLNAENFFIALLSDDRQQLTFPYMVDVKLPPTSRPLGRGLSEYVLRRGIALRADNADIESWKCWVKSRRGVPVRRHCAGWACH
jgi:hypothetical protein